MEEQTMPQTNAMESSPVMQTPPVVPPQAAQTMVPAVQYASFGVRFLALFIDVIIITIVKVVIVQLMGGDKAPEGIGALLWLVGAAYMVVLTSIKGQTLGKMALKIRVQREDNGANLSFIEAILREVVGKFASGIVLGLGYLWVIWDPKKQGWHDKIAKSVVVKL
ncbi:MAG TPA: RDD family protein [Candidatus Saccharimonadales bacterium]|nr:RDD family protein [Candidatus Saccharimonadales bacterium]